MSTVPLPAAVLFDMDGLLVETEHLWYKAELEVMAELGGDWSPADQEILVGGPLERAVDMMIDRAGGGYDYDDVMKLLLTALEDAGVPLALVSASYRNLVDAVHDALLHELGHELFAVTVAGDDLERTKPFPDPYLHAAAVIGADPRHCVVLEDSHTGSRAGLASGAYVVVVPSLVAVEAEPGLHVMASLTEITPELLGEWSHVWAPR